MPANMEDINSDELNKLIKQANDAIAIGNINAQNVRVKRDYINALNLKKNLLGDDGLLVETKKKYISSQIKDGGKTWDEVQIEERKKIITGMLNSFETNFYREKIKLMRAQSGHYEIQQTWKENILDLYTKYVKNKNKTIKNTDKYVKHKNVNNRMSFFYDEKVDELEGYNYVLKIIYWIMTSIILIVFLFKKQYRNYKMFAFIFLIVTLPFMLPLFNNLVYSYISHFIVDNFFIFIIFSATLLLTIMYFSSTYPFIQVESIGNAVSKISNDVVNKLNELKNVITSNNNISKKLAYDIKTNTSP